MSDRYKQLDAERASKRVIMVDRVIPTLKGKGGKKTSRAGTSGSACQSFHALSSKLMRQMHSQYWPSPSCANSHSRPGSP